MIQIEKLSKSFKTPRGIKKVFSDFSLTVKDGSFLGIAGESGTGKSTLLSIITGLQKPDSGKVCVNGTELLSLNDDEMCTFRNENIGFVSQEQSFLENLSVLDNVTLPALLSKTGKTKKSEVIGRAKKLLSDFGIESLAEMGPSALSGGENRRLLIARALINDPQIIVADEPTDAVSKKQAEEIIGIFKALSKRGKTVILVTHDENALKKCSSVFYLDK
ncbi:ABC transporter ATP-binding protein [uncultured Treponema sp.]|uniref:ABC transporter ATP-binding protein n=1 Tax=uncultured Treponema sp. TaxID=162155 RepID=UPI0025CEA702|nr:ATP-binding cassette domain-containing protein [uncultured Treponema sp.]